jgi:serine/threonine protein kinase
VSTPSAVAHAFCAANGHQFIGPVGAGAFKETFHVLLATGEPQALKVFQPGFSPERTSRELDAMQRCSHPNIGRLNAIAEFYHDGIKHLLSLEEFLPGGTLTLRLQQGLLGEDAARGLGEQLVGAIAHIASHGLVHRDIKPDNILFRDDGVTPVIVDFGLVRDLVRTSLTKTWFIRGPGTPYFAPAEQLRNEKALIDWRSDQFSLGIVISLAAFGLHPYQDEGASLAETVERVAEREPQSARFLAAASQSSMPFLARMTSVWPIERFRTPEGLQRAWGG